MKKEENDEREGTIDEPKDTVEVVDTDVYTYDVEEQFSNVPDVAKPLLRGAQAAFSKIEEMLYSAPAFISVSFWSRVQ